MASAKLKGVEEVIKNIQETFRKTRESRQMNEEIGKFVRTRLRAEIRRRKPLNNTRSFPELKESTKNIRASRSKNTSTHPTFSENRSNITFSGQLVDAINFEVERGGKVVLRVDSTRRQPTFPGEEIKTNKEVFDDLASRGFVAYTATGIEREPRILQRINSIVKQFLRRAIKVNFGS